MPKLSCKEGLEVTIKSHIWEDRQGDDKGKYMLMEHVHCMRAIQPGTIRNGRLGIPKYLRWWPTPTIDIPVVLDL
jgi:hypothetical protein